MKRPGATLCLLVLFVGAHAACGEDPEDGSGGAGGSSVGGAGGGGGAAGGAGGAAGGGGSETLCTPGYARVCYSGPVGTSGVGACSPGIEVCAEDGLSFLDCVGERLPAAADDCATAEDDDCSGAANEQCACISNSARACYSGPAGTQDVGSCHGGLMACLPDGSGFGPCIGEAVPSDDDCSTPQDEDCSGAANDGCLCEPASEAPCYDGPQGTEGMGLCHGGLQLCAADGRSYGPCLDQQLPADELCGNGLDEDCTGTPDDLPDLDADGYTRCTGDCCDDPSVCATPALVNPGMAELPTAPGQTPLDEDCDGFVDEPSTCDAGLAIDELDPVRAAATLGLCGAASGLVSAQWVLANGAPLAPGAEVGLLQAFGQNVTPREGDRLLALSTGRARDSGDPGFCGAVSCSSRSGNPAPPGFPQTGPSCPISPDIADDVALEVQLTAPPAAQGFAFDFRFFSYEYPEWVCTDFNDEFVVIVAPTPVGSLSGNVAFDAQGLPISINTWMEVCLGCPLGDGDLAGTGFDQFNDAGGTPWLTSSVPVRPGESVTVRFAIWDGGDDQLDSTVLLDHFRWLPIQPVVGTTN